MTLGWGHLFVLLAVGLNALGQVVLRRESARASSDARIFRRWRLGLGYLSLAGMTIATQLALTHLTLRELSAWITLSYPATLGLGALWLGERIGRREAAGLALIVGGLVLFALA